MEVLEASKSTPGGWGPFMLKSLSVRFRFAFGFWTRCFQKLPVRKVRPEQRAQQAQLAQGREHKAANTQQASQASKRGTETSQARAPRASTGS